MIRFDFTISAKKELDRLPAGIGKRIIEKIIFTRPKPSLSKMPNTFRQAAERYTVSGLETTAPFLKFSRTAFLLQK